MGLRALVQGMQVRSRLGAVLLAVLLLTAAGAVAGAVIAPALRPGVGPDVAADADEQAAATVLQHPLPQVRDSASGLRRSALTIAAPPPGKVPRMVHQSYSRSGRDVARLTVWRGNLGQTDADKVSTPLGDRTMWVGTRVIIDGSTDVSYAWESDGLAFVLHVNLAEGLSRSDADRIAASVR